MYRSVTSGHGADNLQKQPMQSAGHNNRQPITQLTSGGTAGRPRTAGRNLGSIEPQGTTKIEQLRQLSDHNDGWKVIYDLIEIGAFDPIIEIAKWVNGKNIILMAQCLLEKKLAVHVKKIALDLIDKWNIYDTCEILKILVKDYPDEVLAIAVKAKNISFGKQLPPDLDVPSPQKRFP